MIKSVQVSPQELVLKQEPTAFVDDDGDWVYIRTRKTVTEKCPHCRQNWTHEVTVLSPTLGAGGTARQAWESAARNLRLL